MITTKDKRWLAVAKKMLIYSNHDKYRMYSVLVKGGKIISTGANAIGPAAFFLKYALNRGRHSEVRCLFGLDRRYTKGATIYIAGETKHGSVVLSRPCKSCSDMIERMGIKRVVYHTIEDEIREEFI
jgi:deoxycytidylate deaminase